MLPKLICWVLGCRLFHIVEDWPMYPDKGIVKITRTNSKQCTRCGKML